MPQTSSKKSHKKYAVDRDPSQFVSAGDYISIRPAHVTMHDNFGAAIF